MPSAMSPSAVATDQSSRPSARVMGRRTRMPRATAAGDELPGARLGRDRQEAGDRPGADLLDEGVELYADAGGRGIPCRSREQLPSLAQLGAQGALGGGDGVGHASILGRGVAAAVRPTSRRHRSGVGGCLTSPSKPSSPPPDSARASCPRPRRCRRRCCRSSTSRRSSTWWKRRRRPGIDDILIIIGRNKNNLSNHFDSVPELEVKLRRQGRPATSSRRCSESSDLADIHFVRQGEPKGLGHAVLRARAHVGDSPVRGAARRRPDRRARPAADDDDRRARAHRCVDRRAHGGRPRPHPHVRRGRGRGDRGRRTSSRSPASSRSRSRRMPRRTSPSSAATC